MSIQKLWYLRCYKSTTERHKICSILYCRSIIRNTFLRHILGPLPSNWFIKMETVFRAGLLWLTSILPHSWSRLWDIDFPSINHIPQVRWPSVLPRGRQPLQLQWDLQSSSTFRISYPRFLRAHSTCCISQSCLCDPMDWSPPGSSVHGNSPGKVSCHALL